jgi:signal transduction histidine kinase
MSTISSPLAKAETSSTPPSPSLQRKLWDLLTQPSPQIQEADKRQQARFISAMLFFIFAAVIILVGNALFFATTASSVPKPIFVFLVVLEAGLYGLSRTKYSALAITIFVITTTLSLFAIYFFNPASPTVFYYLMVAVFVSGILLSVRTTAVLVAVIVIGMLLASHMVEKAADASAIVNYVAMLSGIVLVFVQFRNTLENTRKKQITDALLEVESLNQTLSHTNQELIKANAVAKEAARLKSEFMATMSHELRTPLNAMLGFSGILLEGMGGEFDAEAGHMIERIQQNSNRLLNLINDVLDIAKIEAGRMDMVSIPISPRKMAEGWRSQMGVLAEQKHIYFITEVDPELPDLIFGDSDRISQIAINLLSNAFKFTEAGSVTLAMHCKDNAWQIQVIDTGIGIPPHAINYIFDEFRQLDGTSKRAYGGTGLGLAIVRNLCRMMEGTIQVTSKLNEGSTFTVTLPLRPVPTGEQTPIAEVSQ